MEQGLIHIYCGDGKGKTSAAIGLAVRAAGSGLPVLIVRFLKTEQSGELKALEGIPKIRILHPEKSFGFMRTLSEAKKAELLAVSGRLWDRMIEEAGSGRYGLLVIDEFMAACKYGLISKEKAIRFLKEKPAGLEVALTGRDPEPAFLELADYVSEIRKVKHPFDRGIRARKGIEF